MTPTRVAEPAAAPGIEALAQRLAAAATTLGVAPATGADATERASEHLGLLTDRVHGNARVDELWLLWTALTASMPDEDDLQAAFRALDLFDEPADFAAWLLEAGWSAAGTVGDVGLEMDVVTDGVVVDVDFSARHDLHTGIQRVVRETAPRWARHHDLELVAWTDPGGCFRRLVGSEPGRVLSWGSPRATAADKSGEGYDRSRRSHRLVVPWRSRVVLLENPAPEQCRILSGLARYSGNRLGLVGYDLIPAISPELIHEGLPDRFMRNLLVVKHAHRVAGISRAATNEFEGFVAMLPAQGLSGPSVQSCSLPVEVPPGRTEPSTGDPTVVCIGSFEPRKNQIAVLAAAELLWREGLRFHLDFVGGGGWATEFDATLQRLQRAGRPLRRRTAIADDDLWRSVRAARFTVFMSLHEGFGLPVAESLSCGTPCLTSNRGSTQEIADGGGALTADPMDDLDIAAQMRRLLTDDDLVAALREQGLARPSRSWDDYADDLWLQLAAPSTVPTP